MPQHSITDDDDSSEEFVFGVDFSKLDVSSIEFGDDNDVTETDLQLHAAAARERCSELMVKRWNDVATNTKGCCEDSDVSELFRWAVAKGANLNRIECRKEEFGGRGLYVKDEATTIGDVVATLPRSLRIGQNHACQKLGLPKGTADLSALALMVVDALDKDEVFARCLPRQCSNAVFMTLEQEAYWAHLGAEYAMAIGRIRDQATSCVNYIQDCVTIGSDQLGNAISKDCIIWWAIAMVQSRTHGFGSSKNRWMTPVFDFCNHSPRPNCRLEGDSEGNLVLKAVLKIAKGEEITIDYQVPDDAKLVATYGFSLKHPWPVASNDRI